MSRQHFRFAPSIALLFPILAVVSPPDLVAQERTIQSRTPAPEFESRSTDAGFQALLGSAGEERVLAPRLSADEIARIRRIARRLHEGDSFGDVRGEWAGLAEGVDEEDVSGLVRWVLREAYSESVQSLRETAEEVRRLNEKKKAVREEMNRLRRARAEAPGGETATFTPDPRVLSLLEAQNPRTRTAGAPRQTLMTTAELQSYGSRLERELHRAEAELENLGEQGQLANVDLQNWLQKQQQMLQMLSNMSKQLHDTARAVIRNTKG